MFLKNQDYFDLCTLYKKSLRPDLSFVILSGISSDRQYHLPLLVYLFYINIQLTTRTIKNKPTSDCFKIIKSNKCN